MSFSFKFNESNGHVDIDEGSTVVPKSAFLWKRNVYSVSFPNTIKKIKARAFSFSNITEIKLPDGLEIIGEYAFALLRQIDGLNIPDSVTGIRTQAFREAGTFKELEIGDSVKTIGALAFKGNHIQHLALGDTIKKIKYMAFYDNDIETLAIGKNVQKIEAKAFMWNNLDEVYISDSVKHIGKWAFRKTNISEVTLPFHFKYNIPYSAFPRGTEFNFRDSPLDIDPPCSTPSEVTGLPPLQVEALC